MNLVRCIINANRRDDVTYGVASSSALLIEYDRWLAHGGLVSVYRKAISPRDLLRSFDFDHVAYAQALFTGAGNVAVLESLFAEIDAEFAPDVIVSFTQNAVIEKLSERKLVLFSERGPLPRWSTTDNFYFEPAGHQRNSVLAKRISDVAAFEVDEERALAAATEFRRIQGALSIRQDSIARFQQWLESNRNGRKVALIANQPHDSLLVAGAAAGISLEKFMMMSVEALSDDWCAFATYHHDMGNCSELDQHIAESFPNYFGLPPELRQFGSDPFAADVDALITVGSKAAFPAALLGKKIVANSSTMLAGLSIDDPAKLDDAPSLTDIEAGRVLSFFSHRYTIPYERLLQTNGFWLSHIEALLKAGSREDYLLEATEYTANSMAEMFGR